MTRIDFYILPDMAQDASLRFACRLGLKGFQAGQLVHIHTGDVTSATALDELMWDYPKHRFLPHQLITTEAAKQGAGAPIHIGYGEPEIAEGLLINLSNEVPVFFGRFDRVAEVIVGDSRAAGRARYKHYRDRGYQLHHHELNDWEQN